ncbi:MAG: glycosyltransferase, partial [Candidatus Aenigmatarchaeota archaeon]
MYKILIPAYNEENIIYRILKSNLKHSSEIIVIDDCSTDNTWSEINRFYRDFPKSKIKKVRMKKNGKKIKLIKKILKKLNSSIKYVILLDADSILSASKHTLTNLCKRLEKDNLSGGSFKIMVRNKKSVLGKLFHIESGIREFWNSFVSRCYKLRCVPGGGSIFKREILEKALDKHSGEFYGEDLETTAIIIENKNRIGYFP